MSNQSQLHRRMIPRIPLYILLTILILIIVSTISGQSAFASTASDSFNLHEQVGHEMKGMEHGSGSQLTLGQVLFYMTRAIYYGALLISVGLMLWFSGIGTEVQRKSLQRWSLTSIRILLIATLLFVFVHSREMMSGYEDGGVREWLRIFTETNVGLSWIVLLVLAFLGFIAIRMQDPVKAVWALLITAAESWNGHVLALRANQSLAIVFDFVHLAFAAIWAGGLVLLLALWLTDRKEAGRFAGRFTSVAWISMAMLIVTGAGITLILLPSLSYLFYTNWGTLLLVKCGLVLLILIVGAGLRVRIRRGGLPQSSLLRADGVLLCAVIIIVALFTYLSPVPNNEPVNFHKMGLTQHLTVKITPNQPGNNDILVMVWLPTDLGTPESITLTLKSVDKPSTNPLEIALEPFKDESYNTFEGFERSSYRAAKANIPFPGKWSAQLTVKDRNGSETNEEILFRNY
ncbi:MAG: copper resistance D family protein [Candidatus Pristimantibacillus sp.]